VCIGIQLDYDETGPLPKQSKATVAKRPVPTGKIGLGVIGTGQFTKGILLPALMDTGRFGLVGVASAKGMSAKTVAERYRARYGVAEADQVLDDADIDAVLITTRHDSHARYVLAALERGKHVFVEKPLAITPHELEAVARAARASSGTLTVGFNRRFSPMVQAAIGHFADREEPLTMLYRVNAGRIPLTSEMGWVHDPVVGGGRIIGEACHFVDVLQAVSGARPIDVSVMAANIHRADLAGDDTVSFSIAFDDGSVGSVHYWANGDPSFPKEHMEVFGGERIAVMQNFSKLELVEKGRKTTKRSLNGDKGYAAEAKAFAEAIETGLASISLDSQIDTTLVTFAVSAALRGEQQECPVSAPMAAEADEEVRESA
ncbi:MAG: Gfo/Idh/MocA family protein, partial [Geminicoccaceae bacterium]